MIWSASPWLRICNGSVGETTDAMPGVARITASPHRISELPIIGIITKRKSLVQPTSISTVAP